MLIDCFMVVADEPNAEINWDRLISCFPAAKKINNAGSILKSYTACAKACQTGHFFVVDADNWILDDFSFHWDYPPKPGNVYVWRAKNPVNELVYGHGAIKLFCASDFIELANGISGIDITSGLGATYHIVNELASLHNFNSSPFHSWRTAFRECVKLAIHPPGKKGYEMAMQRLNVWVSSGEGGQFADWCVEGARQGHAFARKTMHDPSALALINDYAWMNSVFMRLYGGR